jgi:hypothetical protein
MVATTYPTHQTEIWGRALDQQPHSLSPEAAKYFIGLTLSPSDEERVNLLASKARADSLSAVEANELEEYRRSLRLMDSIKLRARLVLKRNTDHG